jgi:photosystem II stability/assembly factor-like uncharacterized protein
MKKTIQLLAIFSVTFGLSIKLHAQNMPFAFQAPLPTAHKYNDAQMLDANTAVAVGATGAFIKSNDAGATWNYVWTKTHVDLLGVDFADLNTGYAVGNSLSNSPYTLTKTIDGGLTWDTLNMGIGFDFNDVDFVSPDTGWIVGVAGNIYKTVDGGINWTSQGITSSFAFTVIKMIDANIGYAAGENGMFYKTIDGGASWSSLGAGTSQTAITMFWRNANEGLITFTSGIIKKTTDGGQTWINCNTTNGPFDVTSIHMSDSLNGIGTTTQADIVRSTNGGLLWDGTNNFGNQPWALAFNGAQNGVFVGYYGCIQRSTDGGATIIDVAAGNNYYNYNKIKFIDANHGWCVGAGGRVLRTTNAGQAWTLLTPNIGFELLDLHFVNQNLGFVVGNSGTVKKTTNGGTTFTNLSVVPSNTDVYSVFFLNQNIGWIGGESGALYKTTNGGTSWTQQTLPTFPFAVFQIYFADANIGYASGAANGNLYKTIDGGTTWIQLSQNMLQLGSIKQFQFFNTDTGYAITSQWNFIKTIDGGNTWTQSANFCVGAVMHFYDENYGVIGGDNGNFNCKMYQTNDGGLTWSNTQVPFAPNINALYMTDTNSVYIAGDDGSIANFGGVGGITTTLKNENSYQNNNINIYPNPASTALNINLEHYTNNAQIEIINAQGQVVFIKNISSKNIAINIETLPKGIYFVRLIDDKNWKVKKVIVE